MISHPNDLWEPLQRRRSFGCRSTSRTRICGGWRPAPRRMWWNSGLDVMNNSKLIEWTPWCQVVETMSRRSYCFGLGLGHLRAALGRPPKLFGDGVCGRGWCVVIWVPLGRYSQIQPACVLDGFPVPMENEDERSRPSCRLLG